MKGTMWTILLVAALGGCSDTDHSVASEKQAGAHSGVSTAFELQAGAAIAARCMDCHGTGGVSTTPNIPHLAGQHQHLDCVRQRVDIQHLDALKLGHLIQVEIVGDDGTIQLLGKLHQFVIDLADGFDVHLGDGHRNGPLALQFA